MATEDETLNEGQQAPESGDEGQPTGGPETGETGDTGADSGAEGDTPPAPSIGDSLRKAIAAQQEGQQGQPATGQPATGQQAQPQPPADTTPVPTSWGAAAREHWANLPPEVKAAIAKRETEVRQGFTSKGEELKQAQTVARDVVGVIGPYKDYLQANGGLPHIGRLLEAGRAITTGDVNQRAAALGNLMVSSGIGLGAFTEFLKANPAMLEQVKQTRPVGGQPGPVQQPQGMTPQQVQAMVQKELAQGGRQSQEKEAVASVEKFLEAKPEFFDLVKDRVLDGVAAAVNRNEKPDVGDLYEAACWANPEIRKLLMANPERLTGKAPPAKKKAAATSVSGSPGGNPAKTAPGKKMSIRDSLIKNFREAGHNVEGM